MVWQDSKNRPWRYAILRHSRQQDVHWDLLLELPERALLATWQMHTDPAGWNGSSKGEFSTTVRALPDHRRIYLEYEGPISGDRGQVTRVEEGQFQLLEIMENKLVMELSGKSFHGRIELTLMDSAAGLWQLCVKAI
ncbi:MAG TPA: hypothetical protein VMG59_09975 [Phycisphaerae bacterium]|nr:hypothetical protein [Phycisphaerae bacterium]